VGEQGLCRGSGVGCSAYCRGGMSVLFDEQNAVSLWRLEVMQQIVGTSRSACDVFVAMKEWYVLLVETGRC
jgi:hypothetical protein